MNIQVLGSGCATCKKLHELTQEAAKQLKLDEKVEYITDISKLIELGVMSSPVLAIDGKPVMVGFVPNIEKIKELLTTGASVQNCDCKKGDDCCGDDCKCGSKPTETAACSCGGKC